MATANNEIEKRLWDAADELRANSRLKASEYAIPVLGLIFLRYADVKFTEAEKRLAEQGSGLVAVFVQHLDVIALVGTGNCHMAAVGEIQHADPLTFQQRLHHGKGAGVEDKRESLNGHAVGS